MPVSISGTNGVTFPDSSLQAAAASPYVLKNRIINGAMMIDQRNAGASVTTTNNVAYTIDRYRVVALGTSLGFSSQRSSTSTNGFVNSYLATVTSAKTVASTDQTRIDQFIEGFNVADLGFGTASAQTVTLSFWVRSSVTGTYCVTIANGSSPDRCYIAEYTISSANTFEYKTITISGDTTGTWAKDNTAGMGVSFILGMGSSFNGAVGWQSGEKYQTSNQTQWIGTSGATFYITGVQLEQNTSATPFERRLYGQELINCQRYYQKSYAQGTAPGTNTSFGCATFREYGTNVYLPNFQRSLIVTMRGSPTITWYTTGGTAGSVTVGVGTNTINTQYDLSDASTGWMLINGSVSSGSQIYAQFTASAEL